MIIFLIGFMGAGKSHWGQKLASELEYSFLDSDNEIEKKMQKSIHQIFKEEGEDLFRLKEAEWLKCFSDEKSVVATGGGMTIYQDNLMLMNQKGITLYIDEPFEILYSRIESSNRPLLNKSKKELEGLYKERRRSYEQAKFTINSPGTISDILNALN